MNPEDSSYQQAATNAVAKNVYETFASFIREGFTRPEALRLAEAYLTALVTAGRAKE